LYFGISSANSASLRDKKIHASEEEKEMARRGAENTEEENLRFFKRQE